MWSTQNSLTPTTVATAGADMAGGLAAGGGAGWMGGSTTN